MPIKNKTLLLLMSILTTNVLYNAANAGIPVIKYTNEINNDENRNYVPFSSVKFGDLVELCDVNTQSDNREVSITQNKDKNIIKFTRDLITNLQRMSSDEYSAFINKMQPTFDKFDIKIDSENLRFASKPVNSTVLNDIINGRLLTTDTIRNIILSNDNKSDVRFDKFLIKLHLLALGVNDKYDLFRSLCEQCDYNIKQYKYNNANKNPYKLNGVFVDVIPALANMILYDINNAAEQNDYNTNKIVSNVLYTMTQFYKVYENKPHSKILNNSILNYIIRNFNGSEEIDDAQFQNNDLFSNIMYYCHKALCAIPSREVGEKDFDLFNNKNITEQLEFLIREVIGTYSGSNESSNNSQLNEFLALSFTEDDSNVVNYEDLLAMKNEIIGFDNTYLSRQLKERSQIVDLLDMVARNNYYNITDYNPDIIDFKQFRKEFRNNAKYAGLKLLKVNSIQDLSDAFREKNTAIILSSGIYQHKLFGVYNSIITTILNTIQEENINANSSAILITDQVVENIFSRILNNIVGFSDDDIVEQFITNIKDCQKRDIISELLDKFECDEYELVHCFTEALLKMCYECTRNTPVHDFVNWLSTQKEWNLASEKVKSDLQNEIDIHYSEIEDKYEDEAKKENNDSTIIKEIINLVNECSCINDGNSILEKVLGKKYLEEQYITQFNNYKKVRTIIDSATSANYISDTKGTLRSLLKAFASANELHYDNVQYYKKILDQIEQNNKYKFTRIQSLFDKAINEKYDLSELKEELSSLILDTNKTLSKNGIARNNNINTLRHYISELVDFIVSHKNIYENFIRSMKLIEFSNLINMIIQDRTDNDVIDNAKFARCYCRNYIFKAFYEVLLDENYNINLVDNVMAKLHEMVEGEMCIELSYNNVVLLEHTDDYIVQQLEYLGEKLVIKLEDNDHLNNITFKRYKGNNDNQKMTQNENNNNSNKEETENDESSENNNNKSQENLNEENNNNELNNKNNEDLNQQQGPENNNEIQNQENVGDNNQNKTKGKKLNKKQNKNDNKENKKEKQNKTEINDVNNNNENNENDENVSVVNSIMFNNNQQNDNDESHSEITG